jgi:hypothetical protein
MLIRQKLRVRITVVRSLNVMKAEDTHKEVIKSAKILQRFQLVGL